MQVFFGVLAFIVICSGVPIVYIWSTGGFVGQRPAPKLAKAATLGVVSLSIGYSGLLAVQQVGFGSLGTLAMAALLAGSAITGIVALQESFKHDTKETTP